MADEMKEAIEEQKCRISSLLSSTSADGEDGGVVQIATEDGFITAKEAMEADLAEMGDPAAAKKLVDGFVQNMVNDLKDDEEGDQESAVDQFFAFLKAQTENYLGESDVEKRTFLQELEKVALKALENPLLSQVLNIMSVEDPDQMQETLEEAKFKTFRFSAHCVIIPVVYYFVSLRISRSNP